jgi:competence protein ComEA
MVDEQEFWNRPPGNAEHARRPVPRPAAREAFAARAPDARQRLIDRVHDLRSDARFGVVVLVAVAVVAGVVWYRVGVGGSRQAGAAPNHTLSATGVPSTTSSAPANPSSTPGTPAARIAVHVAGAVANPGVVELPAGSRVIDAVDAVGGAVPDADLDRLNLAAKLVDGQRIFVPKVGQADPGAMNGDDTSGSGGGPGAAAPGGKLNLNTATAAQLEELPGIGPTYAQAIIAERQRRGGFKSVNELRTVHGIGDKRFAELAPLVTV